jgi:hypothetical protein
VRTEGIPVPPKTRLDPVVRLKEQREEIALRGLADAARRLAAAEDELRRSRDTAAADCRKSVPAPASEWLLTELAHTRALADVRLAELAVQAANDVSLTSRTHYTVARSNAEALRKVKALRIEEVLQQRASIERRELDEFRRA